MKDDILNKFNISKEEILRELSSDIIISAIGGIFITLISIFLAIDYWITPEKFLLKFFSGTDIISIKIHKEILGECREILSYLNENTIN